MAGVPPFSPGNLGNFMKKIREIDFWKKILQLSGVFHLDPESLRVRSYLFYSSSNQLTLQRHGVPSYRVGNLPSHRVRDRRPAAGRRHRDGDDGAGQTERQMRRQLENCHRWFQDSGGGFPSQGDLPVIFHQPLQAAVSGLAEGCEDSTQHDVIGLVRRDGAARQEGDGRLQGRLGGAGQDGGPSRDPGGHRGHGQEGLLHQIWSRGRPRPEARPRAAGYAGLGGRHEEQARPHRVR